MSPIDHARLAPSFAKTWIRCALAPHMAETVGDEESAAAAEGTILHGIMEACLKREIEPHSFIGETLYHGDYSLKITEEIADLLRVGLDRLDAIPGKMFVERRVRLDRWLPGQFGTLDTGFIGKRRLVIWDNKFGRVPVSPERNEQLMLYGLGFWDNFVKHRSTVSHFTLMIWQPYAPGGGGEWDVSLEELLEFGREVEARGKATYAKNPKAAPGPIQCEYCPGAKSLKCEAYVAWNTKGLLQAFDDLEGDMDAGVAPRRPPPALTDDTIAYLVEHTPRLKDFLDRLCDRERDKAGIHGATKGLKLIPGRNLPRAWRDAEAADKILEPLIGEDRFFKKLRSPTQIEEEVGPRRWETLKSLVTQGDPKPRLVPISAPGSEITPLIDMFED